MQKRKQNKSSKQKRLRKRGTKRVKKIYGGSRSPLFNILSIERPEDIPLAVTKIVENMKKPGSNAQKSLAWFSHSLYDIPASERYIRKITGASLGNEYISYIEIRNLLVENRTFLAYLMLMFDEFRRKRDEMHPLSYIPKYGDALINLGQGNTEDNGVISPSFFQSLLVGNRFYGYIEHVILLLRPFLQQYQGGTSNTRIPLELLKEHTTTEYVTIPMLRRFLGESNYNIGEKGTSSVYKFSDYDDDVMASLISRIGDQSEDSPFKGFMLSRYANETLAKLRNKFNVEWPDMPELTTWPN